MDAEARKRLRWVELFLQVRNCSIVCLKCGISRPTLRKWLRRYEGKGTEGLIGESRKPKSSPATKILVQHREWIRELRNRCLGSRRIHSELKRAHDFDVSRTTIDKVLRAMDVKPLSRPRRHRKGSTRYARLIPGERIQMDTCKIAPAVYQYTAIDDCTRIRVLAVYPRRTAANSLLFLERLNEEMPFPVQAIQTDRGREFFAYCFQEKLMQYAIKFRPIKPASPHLNGKVERSQRTDLDEFYPTVDPKSPDLQERLQEWQDHYNQYRPHGSLNGRTPWEAWLERVALTPFHDDVEASYDDSAERIRHPDYQMDLRLAAKNKGNRLVDVGALPPNPRDLAHSRQNG
jgi:transposase InsO family protein